MKITLNNYHIKHHPNSRSVFRGEGNTGEEQLYKSNLPQATKTETLCAELHNKNVNKSVKKTADLKSSGFFNAKKTPSFGTSMPKPPSKVATWIADSPIVHKFLKLAGKNPAVFEAVAALIVAGAVRPATIMALPASKKDKEKNKKAAAHSIASGLIGLASTCILFQPITAAMTKLKDNPTKYGIDKNSKMFDRLDLTIKGVKRNPTRMKVYNDFIKYSPKILFAPVTAAATIALIPIIDKLILSKIFSKNEAARKAEMTPMDVYRSTSFKSKTEKNEQTFKSFTGGQG